MDWLPDLSDPAVWSVIAIKSLSQPQARVPIAAQELSLTSAICLVSVQCFVAPPTWYQAGWATALLLADGQNKVIVKKQMLSLQEASLIVLPKVDGFYYLQISFPRWVPQVRLIVKEFTGEDIRVTEQIDRIQSHLEIL